MVGTGTMPDSLGPQGMMRTKGRKILALWQKAHARKWVLTGGYWERSSGQPLQ